MEYKMIQVEDCEDFKEFKLCNLNNEKIVSFDVELNKETALISYETKEKFRNMGFASYGLNLLKSILFSDKNILFLELINLSGDYSRKVAENAGFFSPTNTPNYYVCINPEALEIVNERIDGGRKELKLLDKINRLRDSEEKAKMKMLEKLNQLLEYREITDDQEYIKEIEAEIGHLERILESQDKKGIVNK